MKYLWSQIEPGDCYVQNKQFRMIITSPVKHTSCDFKVMWYVLENNVLKLDTAAYNVPIDKKVFRFKDGNFETA